MCSVTSRSKSTGKSGVEFRTLDLNVERGGTIYHLTGWKRIRILTIKAYLNMGFFSKPEESYMFSSEASTLLHPNASNRKKGSRWSK